MTEKTPQDPQREEPASADAPNWYQPYAPTWAGEVPAAADVPPPGVLPYPPAQQAYGAPPFGGLPPGGIPPYGDVPPGAVPPGVPPEGAKVRRRGRTRPVAAVALVAGTIAASAAVGHEVWPSYRGSTAISAGGAQPGTTSPFSGGSGSDVNPFSGGDPFSGDPGSATDPNGGGSGSASSTTEGQGGPSDVASIAAKVNPAVVDINTTFGYQGASGAGTGIVLTSNGEILTNNHVINGATSIKVTDVGNGRTYSANVVGYDASHDVAVLQLVGASDLTTASIANSNHVKVGDPVVAVGNAGGTGGTPSAAGGSITALDQTITAGDQLNGTSESLSNLIETNANVRSGDSGGPLVDSAGRVVGMDSAAAEGASLQSSLNSASQGYAIPINQALSIAKQIEAGRASSSVHVGSTAFLGVLMSSSSGSGNTSIVPGSASGGNGSSSTGAVVGGVVPGGAAQQAGLGQGDMITSLDGQSVDSAASLSRIMATEHAGRSVQITWTDSSGATHTATTTLRAGPPA